MNGKMAIESFCIKDGGYFNVCKCYPCTRTNGSVIHQWLCKHPLCFLTRKKTRFKHNTWLKLKGDRHSWSQSIECECNMCYAQRNAINKYTPLVVKI